jgi:hypothetical protein
VNDYLAATAAAAVVPQCESLPHGVQYYCWQHQCWFGAMLVGHHPSVQCESHRVICHIVPGTACAVQAAVLLEPWHCPAITSPGHDARVGMASCKLTKLVGQAELSLRQGLSLESN